MSRNLGCTGCAYCLGTVVLVGPVQPITKDQAFVYFPEYEGMLVADAECQRCLAPYLAWVDQRTCVREPHRGVWACHGEPFFDLSHRSSFDDEPGPKDKPKFKVKVVETVTLEPWTADEWGKEP